MGTAININFKVTPAQKEAIVSRMLENGFDEISSYLKVVALQTEKFNSASADLSIEGASVELGFQVNELQKEKIEKRMKESDCENLTVYLKHIALHGVITAVVEIRSTGNLNAMLERIAKAKRKS